MAMSNGLPNAPEGKTPASRRSALDWVAETVGNEALLRELHVRARRRRRQRVIALGGAAVALAVCFLALRPLPRPPADVASSNRLHLSIPRQQVLPDGSVAELRDGAEIAVEFSGAHRRITLVRGDAHFSVQKDPGRPFIVKAAGVEVRAVGTAFAVQRAARGIEVLVTEGRVAVDRPAATMAASPDLAPLAYVAAGEATLIEASAAPDTPPPPARVTAIDNAEMTERLSWRVPRLEFSGTPLEAAVEAFNRHSTIRLVIGDASLSGLQVSGIVRADQADALVILLAANYGVRAEQRGGETLLLRRPRQE